MPTNSREYARMKAEEERRWTIIERRAYKLIDIEKYQLPGQGSPKLTSLLTADTIKSIADLVAFVKGFEKQKKP